jgi:hypothetical protein
MNMKEVKIVLFQRFFFSRREKRLRHENGHLYSFSADVTNEWNHTSAPPRYLRDTGRDKATSFFSFTVTEKFIHKIKFCLTCSSSNTFKFIFNLHVNLFMILARIPERKRLLTGIILKYILKKWDGR